MRKIRKFRKFRQNSKFSENKADIYTVNGVTENINDSKTDRFKGNDQSIKNNYNGKVAW